MAKSFICYSVRILFLVIGYVLAVSFYSFEKIKKTENFNIDHIKLVKPGLADVLLLVMSIFFLLYSFKKYRAKENSFAEKENIILSKNKILEQEISKIEKKNTSLLLCLNLKIETEKKFLEDLKQMRRSKNIDTEKFLSELLLKTNVLLNIDKNNNDLIAESLGEYRLFAEKLLDRFPGLTCQEIKFCLYYRLEMSSKEISLLEKISEGSARVYKAKIKFKMNLGKDTNLNSFLKEIC